jgi:hypothetical protein
MWIEILRKEVEAKSPKIVAAEIGYSRTTVDLVLKGTYTGSLDKVKERVMAIYGHNGNVICDVLGVISPSRCADNWDRAKRIGNRASNPDTLRLYNTCLRCSVRK